MSFVDTEKNSAETEGYSLKAEMSLTHAEAH